MKQRFPVGTKYKPVRKHAAVCEVTDFLKVTNLAGDVVRTYYMTTHDFCGQRVTETEVCDTTIARGLLPEYLHLLSA